MLPLTHNLVVISSYHFGLICGQHFTFMINQDWDLLLWFLQTYLFPTLFTGAGARNSLTIAGIISYSALKPNAMNICLLLPRVSGGGVPRSSHDTVKA